MDASRFRFVAATTRTSIRMGACPPTRSIAGITFLVALLVGETDEAFAERTEQGVEAVARKDELTGAVPVHVEAHAGELVVDEAGAHVRAGQRRGGRTRPKTP